MKNVVYRIVHNDIKQTHDFGIFRTDSTTLAWSVSATAEAQSKEQRRNKPMDISLNLRAIAC